MMTARSRRRRSFGVAAASVAVATALPASAADPPDPEHDPAHESTTPDSQTLARLWVGVSGALDFVYLPAGTDVCRLGANGQPATSPHYNCIGPSGSDFPSPVENAQLTVAGQAGRVGGGFGPGDVRVMLAVDYAATANILAGVRLGYVLNAYPGEAAVTEGHALGFKLHAEVRGMYVFGHRPLTHEGFAPLILVGGGVSEFDGHSTSSVTFDHIVGEQPVVAWFTDAPAFFVLGGGVRYQFSPRVAFMAIARFNGAVGGNGFLPTYGPELTVQYGLF